MIGNRQSYTHILVKQKSNNPFSILVERLRGYWTGICRDIAVRKRKTEVPEQLNPVIKAGEAFGLEMPLTKKIVEMIEQIEIGERQQTAENLEAFLTAIKAR